MGTISVVFGAYELVSTPDVFHDTLWQRVIFLAVCMALVCLRRGSRWTYLAPWLGAAFVMAMFVMMEGIVAASDPTKPIYPFNGLTLLGPAAALLLPLQLRHGVVMVGFILFGHAAVGLLAWQARMAVLVNELFVLTAASLITLVAVQVTDSLRYRAFRANRALEAEKARSEQLLLNVLPASIAERLKNSDSAIADRMEHVSILFADVVGFTPLSASLSPERLVEVLNDLFTEFDAMAAELGLEKIKTIGDNYMVASGLPVARTDHATALAEMALRMRDRMQTRPLVEGQRLRVRIGMNSGPVVAGVIGKTKFAYDVWGDTVNVAARMESHGVKDAIQVSAATAELLETGYRLESRGTIAVKGKGEMPVFLLLGAAGSASEPQSS